MGGKAYSILYSFGLSDDNRKKYNTVSNKSEAHFIKQMKPYLRTKKFICVDMKKENL